LANPIELPVASSQSGSHGPVNYLVPGEALWPLRAEAVLALDSGNLTNNSAEFRSRAIQSPESEKVQALADWASARLIGYRRPFGATLSVETRSSD
jgi:hypothetical protein